MNYPAFPDGWLRLSPPVWFFLRAKTAVFPLVWFRWRG